jgi:hypothetical protein
LTRGFCIKLYIFRKKYIISKNNCFQKNKNIKKKKFKNNSEIVLTNTRAYVNITSSNKTNTFSNKYNR